MLFSITSNFITRWLGSIPNNLDFKIEYLIKSCELSKYSLIESVIYSGD